MAAGATARGIASQAEMGGLNASIVLPDADVESAAKMIAGAAMGYAGQKCTATGRVIVLGEPAQFTDALALCKRFRSNSALTSIRRKSWPGLGWPAQQLSS